MRKLSLAFALIAVTSPFALTAQSVFKELSSDLDRELAELDATLKSAHL